MDLFKWDFSVHRLRQWATLAIVIASCILVLGIGLSIRAALMVGQYSRAVAEVTSLRKSGRGASVTFSPVVTFVDRDGITRTATTTTSGSGCPGVGSKVEILYDPRDPRHFELDRFEWLWAGPLAAIGVSLVYLVGGVIVLCVTRKPRGTAHARGSSRSGTECRDRPGSPTRE